MAAVVATQAVAGGPAADWALSGCNVLCGEAFDVGNGKIRLANQNPGARRGLQFNFVALDGLDPIDSPKDHQGSGCATQQ